MLELINATKRFGDFTVLDSLCLKFPEKGVVALLGPSGSGKTTLLRVAAGLEMLSAGEVRKHPDAKISMVFQEDRLIPWLSARENILAVLPPGRESQEKTARLLRDCLLSDAVHLPPDKLSGGMQRRVAIARALAFGGNLLLLDEPFKGLDAQTREDVVRVTLDANKGGLTLLVTHDPGEAERCADVILRFDGPPLRLID